MDSKPRLNFVRLGSAWGASLVRLAPFVLRRLAFGLSVLLAIVFLSYLGLDMAGGTDLATAAGQALPRTFLYWGQLARGDLGLTTAGSDTWAQRPVIDVVIERLPRSLGLLALSISLATLVGLLLGIWAARSRSRRSLGIILATLIGVSVPSFFAAFLLQWAATTYTRYAGRAILPVGGFGWDKHLILPVLVLSARPIAQITRIVFVSVRGVLSQDYVRTAQSKGLRRLRVMVVHVLRNAAIPVLTTISVSLRFALSSLPVVEFYFGWPGVGFTLLKSIAWQDTNLTVALTLCLGMLFILINLGLELAYRLIDPRLLETPAHIAAGQRLRLREAAASIWDGLLGLWRDSPWVRWLARRRGEANLPPLPQSVKARQDTPTVRLKPHALISALTDAPLLIGGVLVLGLILVVFFGPQLAPHSPYRVQGIAMVDGKLVSPPFAPGDRYPWGTDVLGRDLMSLILAGAQQTLLLAALVVAARTAVGVVLGAVAGWAQDSALDRAVVGLAEVIAAFPTLLLAMILILGLGIRKGVSSFVIALCFVGWGEIMQFVRGQVAAIRVQPYIESAVAMGARTFRIVFRHILPHLFAALTSIVALEMGAVLSLLGELGFLSIFIGGGIVNSPSPGRLLLYSDVPEWGALLSDLRYQARSYPWTALYPMLAFFVAILSFNLFGEGIRRLLERGELIVNRLVNRYTVALAALAVMGLVWMNAHGGSLAFYQRHAQDFDPARAMAHVGVLTAPSMSGRALGTAGVDLAAEYIAEQFAAIGLQAMGQEGTAFQTRKRSFLQLGAVPEFEIHDGGIPPVLGLDYALYPGPDSAVGVATGPVRVVGLGQQGQTTYGGGWRSTYVDLERADFSGEVLLTFSAQDAATLMRVRKAGVLVVANNPSLLQRRFTAGGRALFEERMFPTLWISEAVAERLLAGSGYTVAQVRDQLTQLPMERMYELPLPVEVDLQVEGMLAERWPVQHVLGYLPGTHSYDFCDDCLGKRLIVVLAQYDSPAPGPDGDVYPAANDNASGVAVMLEAARLLLETDYQPYKTFLFIAYSSEGLEGGELLTEPDIEQILKSRAGLAAHELEAIVYVRGVGGGSGDRLEVSAEGSLRLTELVERSARQLSVKAVRAEEGIDIGMIYHQGSSFHQGGQGVPTVRLSWEGWQANSRLSSDTVESLSIDALARSGRVLALTLMVLGRETDY
ncbi:MAG: ABC transporter permease subunit [Anaerolineae bacterium]|nr:ABC transporter permease subunit [Anaerolineae bacterium]